MIDASRQQEIEDLQMEVQAFGNWLKSEALVVITSGRRAAEFDELLTALEHAAHKYETCGDRARARG